ncbi:MAG TPA: TolC family protein [Puia sp.]|nr:TolC family protein [Puia sp.]
MVFANSRKFPVLTGLLFLLSPFSLFAQPPVYSLSRLVDSALHHYPLILQKQALLNSAEAAVTDARHSFLPSLQANEQINLGTDNSIPGSYVSYGIIPSSSSGIRDENNFRAAGGNIAILSAQYDLVDFGYRRAYIESAKSRANLFGADREKEIYSLKIQAARLYFNLLKNEFRLEVNRQNVERYENIFSVIRALTLAGLKPGSDSSLAKAELSKSRIVYNQTGGQIRQIKEQLSFLTGIPAAGLEIDTTAKTYIHLRPQLVQLPGDGSPNPFLDYYEQQKKSLLAQEKLAGRTYLPKILLTASGWARGSGISYDDSYHSLPQGLGYQRFNYLAGLSFQYDLFNGIHKHDKLQIYRFRTTAGDEALQQERLALNAAYRQAENALQTARANLDELPVQLGSAENVYHQKLAQYKAGIINLVDLTNAAFVLDRSQNDYIETLTDWYLARLDKSWALGKLDPFINSIK